MKKRKNKKLLIILLLIIFMLLLFIIGLLVGSSNMTLLDTLNALIFKGPDNFIRIVWRVRLPRVIAALICGGGLALAGLIMQTTLNNPMASPSTLGVSNAAVFGANLSILLFSTGSINIHNLAVNYSAPFQTSLVAFLFSFSSIFIILLLCNLKAFSPNAVVLSGIAIASIWTALTTLTQYLATDVGISAAVIWNFGDLSRATYKTDLIMGIVVIIGLIVSMILSWRFNALIAGDDNALSLGVNIKIFRLISLILASFMTSVCVSFLGIIGFIGIIAPHIMKKRLGLNHIILIPTTFLLGSIILLLADILTRTIASGLSLPVGAITTLLGAPFFLYIIFSQKGTKHYA